MLRGESTHMRARIETVAAELLKGDVRIDTGKAQLLDTRAVVKRGWQALSNILAIEGHRGLADQVNRFAERMPPARTEKDWLAEEFGRHLRPGRTRDQAPSR